MNNWVWVILLLLLVGSIGYYLTPVNEKAKPTIQYSKPIGPTQEPPYILPSKFVDIKVNG